VQFVPAREPFHLPRWARQVRQGVLDALGLDDKAALHARIGLVSLMEDLPSHERMHVELHAQTGWQLLPTSVAPPLPQCAHAVATGGARRAFDAWAGAA